MRRRILGLLLFASACARPERESPQPRALPKADVGAGIDVPITLVDARKGFVSKVTPQQGERGPVPAPPPGVLQQVRYASAVGQLAAYMTPDPGDGKRHPAIVWITGGDCNSIGDVWSAAPEENDQRAAVFRERGFVTMYPSLRGGNDGPGAKEGFLGEVDDVIAAGEYLRAQSFVDPDRIYLGGHSTGGTLVLLVAESTDRFRAVFSFGPVDDVRAYPPEFLPFDATDPRELDLRSPGQWLHSIRVPTFVFEGVLDGNTDALRALAGPSNPQLRAFLVPKADHFSVLAPVSRVIADKLVSDVEAEPRIEIAGAELARVVH